MRFLNSFLRDETGAVLIEFVLWVPVLMAVLLVVVDVATIYVTHTEMWNVARDTARRMVTGALLTEDEAETYASEAMNLRQHFNYQVVATYAEPNTVEVIIRYNVADMSILGYTSPMTIFGGPLFARVVMRPDPNTPFKPAGS